MSLEVLRQRYPDIKWKATRNGFGWQYRASNGWTARWVSVLAPRYPDDDGHFQSQLWIYPESTGEQPKLACLGGYYAA